MCEHQISLKIELKITGLLLAGRKIQQRRKSPHWRLIAFSYCYQFHNTLTHTHVLRAPNWHCKVVSHLHRFNLIYSSRVVHNFHYYNFNCWTWNENRWFRSRMKVFSLLRSSNIWSVWRHIDTFKAINLRVDSVHIVVALCIFSSFCVITLIDVSQHKKNDLHNNRNIQ